jgi:hypothetical protein
MLYFSENNIRGNHAGTKARNDAENILRDYGCRPVNSRRYILTSDAEEGIHSNVTGRLQLLKYFLDLLPVKNQTVIVQYPMLAFDQKTEYLTRIAKHNSLVFLVHDVHGLKRRDPEETAGEMKILNLADAVILHNRFMEEKLRECGLKVSRIYRLDIFDYLYEGEIKTDRARERGIAFAGNLEKSDFFRAFCRANPDLPLYLYGQKFDESLKEFGSIRYGGNFRPDLIPGVLCGRYGLVWDGDAVNTCSGIFGEYTRYNKPHKLSLYLAAGMPVIVWDQAAVAEFVLGNGVGVAVGSLEDLEKLTDSIPDEKYQEMLENVMSLRKQLLSGERLKRVLRQLESDFGR